MRPCCYGMRSSRDGPRTVTKGSLHSTLYIPTHGAARTSQQVNRRQPHVMVPPTQVCSGTSMTEPFNWQVQICLGRQLVRAVPTLALCHENRQHGSGEHTRGGILCPCECTSGWPKRCVWARERPNIWLLLGMGGPEAKAPSLSCIQ